LNQRMIWKRMIWLVAIVMLSGLVLAACGDDDEADPTATAEAPAGQTDPTPTAATEDDEPTEAAGEDIDFGSLEGRVNIDGSSTVFPVTQAMAEEFNIVAPNVQVPVGVSGTGGGFAKFCEDETDISNASRPISADEAALCDENGVEYIELPVAYDGLSVVVNPENDWVSCLTIDELATMWAPESEGEITNWNQINPDFPDAELVLYGPGTDSGTYDYFTDAVTGEEGASRGDFTGSEDDNVLVQGVASDVNALGFFGYSYYEENQGSLKLVAIDDGDDSNGEGCIEPSPETINNGTYQPLSRPLFVYVNAESAARPEVAGFVDFYLLEGPGLIPEIGYVPFTEEFYATIYQRYTDGRTGSVFAGGGSSQGVTIDDLLFEDER
jgi:phosphate transport system substrate-binding protein